MTERTPYPGYDVLNKRHSPSWNEPTRRAVDERLSVPIAAIFFTDAQWSTLCAVCDRIVPQPYDRPPVPLAAYIDRQLRSGRTPGYRNAAMPPQSEAWRRGLTALEAECQATYRRNFPDLHVDDQTAMLRRCETGSLTSPAWQAMSSRLFFSEHILSDIIAAYYAHPTAWSEIGFGGPASPQGYVRMGNETRDPWEAIKATPETETVVREKNRLVR